MSSKKEKKEAKKRLTYLKEKYFDADGNIVSHNADGELWPGCSNEEVAELADLLEQEEKDAQAHVSTNKPPKKAGELSAVGQALVKDGAEYLGHHPDGREFFYRKTSGPPLPGTKDRQESQDAICVDGDAKVVGRKFGAKLIGRLKK